MITSRLQLGPISVLSTCCNSSSLVLSTCWNNVCGNFQIPPKITTPQGHLRALISCLSLVHCTHFSASWKNTKSSGKMSPKPSTASRKQFTYLCSRRFAVWNGRDGGGGGVQLPQRAAVLLGTGTVIYHLQTGLSLWENRAKEEKGKSSGPIISGRCGKFGDYSGHSQKQYFSPGTDSLLESERQLLQTWPE